MKSNIKLFLKCVIVTFLIGNLFALFINPASNINLKKIIAVPNYVFPIVWSILYFFMSISLYKIIKSKNINNTHAIKIYFFQLIVNSLWTLFFFKFKLYLFSALWLIFLIALVAYMIYLFFKIDKVSGIINIPYLLWLLFALILNISIVVLN